TRLTCGRWSNSIRCPSTSAARTTRVPPRARCRARRRSCGNSGSRSIEAASAMYLTQGLHRALQQRPARLATVFGGRQRTFEELAERVAGLAGLLRAAGLRPGDRLALLAHNSDLYLDLLLAVWWAGGVITPLNTRWSIPEIAYALRDCGAALLAVDR